MIEISYDLLGVSSESDLALYTVLHSPPKTRTSQWRAALLLYTVTQAAHAHASDCCLTSMYMESGGAHRSSTCAALYYYK